MNELDILYSPSYWAKRLSSPQEVCQYHINFIEKASASTIKKLPCELNIPYGNSERQKIDIFGTDLNEGVPVLIFVHGGYWQTPEISRSSYHYIAENLYKHNIKTIFIGYDLCPDVTLPEITQQIEKATQKCLDYAEKTKSKSVYFMGHSAGAHLISFLFLESSFSKDLTIVKGAILVSGVYDLVDLQKTINNGPLKLDELTAIKMSPLLHNIGDGFKTIFHLIVGQNESPEFIKQSGEFTKKLQNVEIKATFKVIGDVDHFNIVEKLKEEDFEVTKFIINSIIEE